MAKQFKQRTVPPTGRDTEIGKLVTLEECCEAIMANHFGWGQFKQWYIEKTSLSHAAANEQWNRCWEVLREKFKANIQDTVERTLNELEGQKMETNDARLRFEITKYQNKIKGGEIDRQEIKHSGEIKFEFGSPIPTTTKYNL